MHIIDNGVADSRNTRNRKMTLKKNVLQFQRGEDIIIVLHIGIDDSTL